MKLSKYLLTLAFSLALLGAVACSDDSSSSAAADDGKKESFTWDDLQVFDAKADLPSCKKFDGVVQVIDEKAFFVCLEGEWTQIGVSASTYEKLPKCNAPMNDFCIGVGEGEKTDDSYICDEGTWVKGVDGSCLKGDDNMAQQQSLPSCLVDEQPLPCIGVDFSCLEGGDNLWLCLYCSWAGVDGSCLKGDDNIFPGLSRFP